MAIRSRDNLNKLSTVGETAMVWVPGYKDIIGNNQSLPMQNHLSEESPPWHHNGQTGLSALRGPRDWAT